jgi:hypothetical protein
MQQIPGRFAASILIETPFRWASFVNLSRSSLATRTLSCTHFTFFGGVIIPIAPL